MAGEYTSLPRFKGVSRQRGRGIGALAATLGRTAIPFVRKYIVPAAKRVGADLIEFAVPEIGDVIKGKKNVKTFAKNVGTKTLRKQLGGGRVKKRKITKRSTSVKNSRSRSDFFKNVSE